MTTNETNQDKTAKLSNYVQELTTGEAIPMPTHEAWEAMIERVESASGLTAEIEVEDYQWFLEILYPRFILGNCYCFVESLGLFRLFWKRDGRYFTRRLDRQQTQSLSFLAGIKRYQ